MPLTLEQHDMVESELKRFCTDLNLSEDQEAFKRYRKYPSGLARNLPTVVPSGATFSSYLLISLNTDLVPTNSRRNHQFRVCA
jgi:hypothetical protein